MLRIAMAGTYHSILSNVELIRQHPGCLLTGIFTEIHSSEKYTFNDHPALICKNIEQMINIADAIIICDSAYAEFDMIKSILKRSKHVFLYSDHSITFQKTEELQKISEEAGVLLYLRHKIVPDKIIKLISKFNCEPEYIDIYRNIGKHNKTNQTLIYQTIYQELLFVLSLSKHSYRRSDIQTVPYFSSQPVMINIRLYFSNGTSANLTFNNFSDNNTRTIELFQGNKMLYLDSLKSYGRFICHDTGLNGPVKIDGETIKIYEFSDEITIFLDILISSSNSSAHIDNGIILHKTATEIMNKIVPSQVQK